MALDDPQQYLPALVAVSVPNMGRMAIHRNEAYNITTAGSTSNNNVASSSASRQVPMYSSDNRSSTSGTSSSGSAGTSASTMLTQPSSAQHDDECDEAAGVDAFSPSYTIMSSFPPSEQTTPAKQQQQDASLATSSSGLAALFRASTDGLVGIERERAIRAALPRVKNHMAHDVDAARLYKPRLSGSSMPTLDWPDSPDGPWAAAGKRLQQQQIKRKSALARWLAEDSSDDEDDHGKGSSAAMLHSNVAATTASHHAPPAGSSDVTHAYGLYSSHSTHSQHPMVVKALRDRTRKEKLLRARLAHAHASARLQQQPQYALYHSASSMSRAGDKGFAKSRRPKLGPRSSSNSSKFTSHNAAVPALTASERRAARRQKGRKERNAQIASSAAPARSLEYGAAPFAAYGRPVAAGHSFPFIGCRCGHGDEGTPMLRCDSCTAWFHSACVGIHSAAAVAHGWACAACCETDTSAMSPSSVADSTAASLMVTPNFPRSAALEGHALRLSQGELPVFCHPSETPHRRHDGYAHNGLSSALALAPSPVMLSNEDMMRRHGATHAPAAAGAAGRARASRVGWHMQEPGSPLERKGANAAGHRRNLSGSVPSAFRNGSVDDEAPSTADAMAAFLRTPSPRISASTPKRQRNPSVTGLAQAHRANVVGSSYASAGAAAPFAAVHRRETSAVRDFDDVFSTPSRMLHGSAAWDHGHPASLMRHSRDETVMAANAASAARSTHTNHNSGGHGSAAFADNTHGTSTPWGLSTPTRGFMDSAGVFGSSDYSGAADGLPSLVHSSGGLDMGDFAAWQQLQGSPTSSTRAGARAALSSSAGGIGGGHQRSFVYGSASGRRTSSMREGTPDALLYSTDLSSSPFPKTPTFVSEAYGHAGSGTSGAMSASRRLSTMSHGYSLSPTATPTRKFGSAMQHKHNVSDAGLSGLEGPLELHGERRHVYNAKNHQQTQQAQQRAERGRKASTDVMAGLGIGLDLNDGEWLGEVAVKA